MMSETERSPILPTKDQPVQLPEFLTQAQDGEIRLTGHCIGLYHLVQHYNEGGVGRDVSLSLSNAAARVASQSVGVLASGR